MPGFLTMIARLGSSHVLLILSSFSLVLENDMVVSLLAAWWRFLFVEFVTINYVAELDHLRFVVLLVHSVVCLLNSYFSEHFILDHNGFQF